MTSGMDIRWLLSLLLFGRLVNVHVRIDVVPMEPKAECGCHYVRVSTALMFL